MSTEDNKALVRRFVQVWGKGSLDTLDELAAPNFSVYYPFLREIAGHSTYWEAGKGDRNYHLPSR